MGSTNMCLGIYLQTHLGQENGQRGRKGGSTFVEPAIRTFCLFNFFQMWAPTFVHSVHIVYPFPTMKVKSWTRQSGDWVHCKFYNVDRYPIKADHTSLLAFCKWAVLCPYLKIQIEFHAKKPYGLVLHSLRPAHYIAVGRLALRAYLVHHFSLYQSLAIPSCSVNFSHILPPIYLKK